MTGAFYDGLAGTQPGLGRVDGSRRSSHLSRTQAIALAMRGCGYAVVDATVAW